MKIVGIFFDGGLIYSALLQNKKKSIKILSLRSSVYETSDPNVKSLYIWNQKGASHVVSGLCSKNILIRPLSIKVKNLKDLKKTLPFQEESLSLLERSNSSSIPITQSTEEGHKVLLFQTPNKKLYEHIELLKETGIESDTISCEAMALARFNHFLSPQLPESIVFHLGKSKSVCVLIQNNVPIASHTIDMGLDRLLFALKKDLKDDELTQAALERKASEFNLLSLRKKEFPSLYNEILLFKKESARIILSFSDNKKLCKYPLIITGHSDLFPQVHEILYAGSEEIISHVHKESDPKKQSPSLLRYAISVGLALDVLRKDSLSLQFRKDTFLAPSFFRKIGRKLMLLGFTTVAVSGLLLFGAIKAKETSLNRIDKILEAIYEENSSLKKASTNKQTTTARINHLEKDLAKETSPFPFYLRVPSMTQVLSWINSSLNLPEGIDIRSCHYQLESLPTIKKPTAPYSAKITLGFTTSNDDSSSLLQSTLEKDPFVEKVSDVTWNAEINTYEISFYLAKKRGN